MDGLKVGFGNELKFMALFAGFGADIMKQLIGTIEPTTILNMQSPEIPSFDVSSLNTCLFIVGTF